MVSLQTKYDKFYGCPHHDWCSDSWVLPQVWKGDDPHASLPSPVCHLQRYELHEYAIMVNLSPPSLLHVHPRKIIYRLKVE